MTKHVKLAKLDEEQLKKVRELEAELGVRVLAYAQPVVPATLTEEQLAKLQIAETDLGLCLVAYRRQ